VWLVPKRQDDVTGAATDIQIQISDKAIEGKVDVASGAGGKYRYVNLLHDDTANEKIDKVALYRKHNNEGKVTLDDATKIGFDRVSTDINDGRGGDYLSLIYGVSV
jgi:hypothetical protein